MVHHHNVHIAVLVPARGVQPPADGPGLRRRVGHFVPHVERLRAVRGRAQVLGAADTDVAGSGAAHLDPRRRAAREEQRARESGPAGQTDGFEFDKRVCSLSEAPAAIRTLRQLRRPSAAREQPVHVRRRSLGRALARQAREVILGDNRRIPRARIPRVESAETDQAGRQGREKAREPAARGAALPIRVRGIHHSQQDARQRRAPRVDYGEPILAQRSARRHRARCQHAPTSRILHRHQPDNLGIRHRFTLPAMGFPPLGHDPRDRRGRLHNPRHRRHRPGD